MEARPQRPGSAAARIPRIDPVLARARTLPGWVHRDAEFFEATVERVLTRAWAFVGDERDLPADGSAAPATLFPGSLDEPLVLVRDEAGRRRALSNVCTHRANPVVKERGPCRELRCGYHGRRFALDGTLRASPGFEGAEDFPGPRDDLPALGFDALGPLCFAALDPALAFARWSEPAAGELGSLPWGALEPLPERDRDFEVAASWILYVENFLEGFHVPYVHPGLSKAIDLATYTHALRPWGTIQVAAARDGEPAFPPGPGHGEPRIAARYLWLFPTTMLNVYPWGVSVNAVEPLAPDRTRVLFRSFVWNASLLDRGAGADLWQVELEDEAVVEACQRGSASRVYGSGRYAPRHEPGTHHFHRLLTGVLRDGWRELRDAPAESAQA